MSRTLTPAEKNKVKNLQVSNSIYRKDIKGLVSTIEELETELALAQSQEPNLLGEEHLAVSNRINNLTASITSAKGQIAYKENKITGKELEVEAIKTAAMWEDETVLETIYHDSPERVAARNIRAAEEQAAKEAKEAKRAAGRRTKKSADVHPTTQDF